MFAGDDGEEVSLVARARGIRLSLYLFPRKRSLGSALPAEHSVTFAEASQWLRPGSSGPISTSPFHPLHSCLVGMVALWSPGTDLDSLLVVLWY